MKIRNGYTLREIADTTYLLPVGQNVATHHRGIALNETGIFLVHALQTDIAPSALLRLMMTHFEAGADELPAFREDLNTFLTSLRKLDILEETIYNHMHNQQFQFGPIRIGYNGPAELLHPSLLDFACEDGVIDQNWIIIPAEPRTEPVGELLIKTKDIAIYQNDTHYILAYPDPKGLCECQSTLDGSCAYFFCRDCEEPTMRETLFHAFRFTFLLIAQKKGLVMLHSASLLHKGKAWLFSGQSGTGKSTHTNLWLEQFNSPLLNGDLNLIGMLGNAPVVYGIPWCGTSEIYTTDSYPLGGIILLKQDPVNHLVSLTDSQKQLYILQRLISPCWTAPMLDDNLAIVRAIVSKIHVFRYLCTKEPDAAIQMHAIIEDTTC